MACRKCGHEVIAADAATCPTCGEPLYEAGAAEYAAPQDAYPPAPAVVDPATMAPLPVATDVYPETAYAIDPAAMDASAMATADYAAQLRVAEDAVLPPPAKPKRSHWYIWALAIVAMLMVVSLVVYFGYVTTTTLMAQQQKQAQANAANGHPVGVSPPPANPVVVTPTGKPDKTTPGQPGAEALVFEWYQRLVDGNAAAMRQLVAPEAGGAVETALSMSPRVTSWKIAETTMSGTDAAITIDEKAGELTRQTTYVVTWMPDGYWIITAVNLGQ